MALSWSLLYLFAVCNAQSTNWANGVNGAVMTFDKGHPLLYILMESFAMEYRPGTWGSVGPRLITKIIRHYDNVRQKPYRLLLLLQLPSLHDYHQYD